MEQDVLQCEYHIAKNRLETLIDGIFAIAMTLLVLSITIPRPDPSVASAELPHDVLGLVPQVFLFVVAFLVLTVFWYGHHRQFQFVKTVDHRLLWINVFFLITIVLIPFSTDIAGDYPDVGIAVLIFNVNVLLVGLMFCLHWYSICRSAHLQSRCPDPGIIRLWYLQAALFPVVAFIAILVSFVSPAGSLLVYFLAPVPYVLLNRSGERYCQAKGNPVPEPVKKN